MPGLSSKIIAIPSRLTNRNLAISPFFSAFFLGMTSSISQVEVNKNIASIVEINLARQTPPYLYRSLAGDSAHADFRSFFSPSACRAGKTEYG